MNISEEILKAKKKLKEYGIEDITFELNINEIDDKTIWQLSITGEVDFYADGYSYEEALEKLIYEEDYGVMDIEKILEEARQERRDNDKTYWDKQLYARA